MHEILHILEHTLLETVRLIPFLFITYLIMEYIEHKTSNKVKETIQKSGKFGPLLGAIVGIFPQCGFSVSATNLYAARVITLGTLISVYLATSDEMLPILLTESVSFSTILTILALKLIIGIIAGFIIDAVIKLTKKEKQEEQKIEELCEHEHCHCDEGIVVSAVKHTINIIIFIFIITLVINGIISLIGEKTIAHFISKNILLGPIVAGFIGLIPNCASSVILTELFIENVISMPVLISGVAVNAGVGLLVLFKTNKNIKENLRIVGLLYAIGVISGIILQVIL
ncbi:MAG: arsenic efflux protein [Clostridia bacterium]|nr:arsenic efflux protein [Clostridia bacterium]